MIHKLYSMFDKTMEAYGPPQPAPNDMAIRRGLTESLGQDSIMRRHPQDFALYCVGVFDDESGEIGRESAVPRLVCEVAIVLGNGGES